MYNTEKLLPVRYTQQDLLEQVSQASVFSLLGFPSQCISSGKRFCSPLREDKHADCRFLIGTDGKVRFLDPARGISLDWLDAVMHTQQLSFPEAIAWVADNFLHGTPRLPTPGAALPPLGEKPEVLMPSPKKVIQVKRRGMTKEDADWWAQGNIRRKEIMEGRISAISDYWVDGRHFVAPKKGYAYEEDDGYKLYFPENVHKLRFLSTTSALSCYELLPQVGDLLLITSSKKDALTLRSFNYNVVAPQGEGIDIPTKLLWELKQRFKQLVIFYDNDAAGLKLAKEKLVKWQVNSYIHLPIDGPKDPWDYCKQHGPDQTLITLTQLLNEPPLSQTQPV